MKGVVAGMLRKVMAAPMGILARTGKCQQGHACNLHARDQQEYADQQAQRDTARHRTACETATSAGWKTRLRKGAQETAALEAVARRGLPLYPGAKFAHPRSRMIRPCSRFQSRSFSVARFCRGPFLPLASASSTFARPRAVEIDRQRDKRHALAHHGAMQLVYLAKIKEQFTWDAWAHDCSGCRG